MRLMVEVVGSPIGALTCVTAGGALVAVDFEGNAERLRRSLGRRFGEEAAAAALARADARGESLAALALAAYFQGDLAALDGVAADPGGTPFERRVYEELRRVRRGEVTTYSELARRAGRPAAVRAVGAANAKNPVSIVVPCHRVIGADGSLTGYAGGLERKRWLLEHERATRS